jgi:hypothetical protein
MESGRLTGLIERGQIGADDWVWHEDLGEWRQLHMLGVFPAARPASNQGRGSMFATNEDAGQWQPGDDGGSLEAPSLTSIYLKRLGRQADHADAAQPRDAGPQPPTLPVN